MLALLAVINKFAIGEGRGTGGNTIILNIRCPSRQIQLKTKLHTIAVSFTMHRIISICSIIIPPRAKIEQIDLDEIVNHLPSPYLLLGDINGHNVIWCSDDVNDRGRIIEKIYK